MTSVSSPDAAARRRPAGAAVAVAVLCVVATAATVWLDVALGDARPPGPLDWPFWGSALSGLPLALAGGVLGTRLPRHPITWLMLAGGAVAVANGFGAAYASTSVLLHHGDLPGTGLAVFVGGRAGPLINMIVPLTLLFFPDGRLPSRRWWWPAGIAVGLQALGALVLLTIPWDVMSGDEGRAPGLAGVPLDPLTPPLPDGFWPLTPLVFWIGFLLAFFLGVAAFATRFRRSDEARRTQLRWMLLALVTDVVLLVALMAGTASAPQWAKVFLGDVTLVLMHVVIAAAVVVAVARYRLYDVDLLLGRTLLYAGLAAVVVGIDVAVFVTAGMVIDEPVAAVAGAGVVAVLYAPLRVRLQRWVERVLTGRAEPYDVVSALAARLEESVGPDELLAEVARVVASSFRSPYVRVELDRPDGRTVVVEHGGFREGAVVLPFEYRGTAIGRLALVPRAGARLSDADQRLLADVVRQAAAAAHATALSEELQAGRERLVTAVAEERRRLRRDLHDGLGPALAAATLKIEAARHLAVRDAAGADGTLVSVRGDLSAVLGDVRRLVHDLRPPSLDQFGLAGAVEQVAARFHGRSLRVSVRCSGELGSLPAAVEEAAYRIVGEALSNVARHAAASAAVVSLAAVAGALEVEVADDGRGVRASAPAGVGLVGMRERAAELGGLCTVERRAQGGTRVHAHLPFGPRPATLPVQGATALAG